MKTMKKMKKIFAMVLAVMMIMTMAVTVSAATEGDLTGGTIIINDATPGATYNAWQILVLVEDATSEDTYKYVANTAWEAWLATDDAKAYVSIDDNGYVTWVEEKLNDAGAAEFAKLAIEYAKTNNIAANETVTATTTTVSIMNLNLGYYLVDTTTGTLCSLDAVTQDIVMSDKNEVPVPDKEVLEDSDETYGETNDAEIGQVVDFKTVIKAYAGAENYVLHDRMTVGLTFNEGSIQIEGLTAGTDYTVITSGLTDDCDFEIIFTKDYLDTVTGTADNPTLITVTYSATVNENAVIADTGNVNETKLTYGEDNETEWDPTKTYVWGMEIVKIGDGDETKRLSGAQFIMLNADKNKIATFENGKLTGWADYDATATEFAAGQVITTDKNGEIAIEGLDSDTYYLKEIKAPAGYNKLKDDVQVVVKEGTITNDTITYEPVVATVNNESGTELPSTGGIGTTLFYIVGGVLVVGAVVLLATKKRMAR